MTLTIDIPDLAATEAFGRALGATLFPGAVIALIGDLGAGKTHLARAIVDGLGGDPGAVSSPTFVLIQEYTARLPVYHFDAYRLKNDREFRDLGTDEYLYGDSVCLIEWADRVPDALPAGRLEIRIERVDESQRRFHITAFGERHVAVLRAIESV